MPTPCTLSPMSVWTYGDQVWVRDPNSEFHYCIGLPMKVGYLFVSMLRCVQSPTRHCMLPNQAVPFICERRLYMYNVCKSQAKLNDNITHKQTYYHALYNETIRTNMMMKKTLFGILYPIHTKYNLIQGPIQYFVVFSHATQDQM